MIDSSSMPDIENVTEEGKANLFLRTASLYHQAEVLFVLVMLSIETWGLLRTNREMLDFACLFGIVCMAAAWVALSPRTSPAAHLIAEVLLLVVALGQVVGPQHDFIPFLSREIKGASRWNNMPLTDRRILVWNLISAFTVAWFLPAVVFLVGIVLEMRRSILRAIGAVALWLIVCGGMGILSFLVLQAFFSG